MSPVLIAKIVTDKRFWKIVGALLVCQVLIIAAIGTSCTANNMLAYERDTVSNSFEPIVQPINAKIEGEKINSFLLHAVYITYWEKPNVLERGSIMKQLVKCFYTEKEVEYTVKDDQGHKHTKTKKVYAAITDTDTIFRNIEKNCGIEVTDSSKQYAIELSQYFSGYSDNTYIDLSHTDADMKSDTPTPGTTLTGGSTPVVYYNQCDPQYRKEPYGTDNIGDYACGPTSMAIVISSLTNQRIDPIQSSKWAYDHGYWCKGSGSYRSLIPNEAKEFGLQCTRISASQSPKLVQALSSGKLIVAIMGPGHFCDAGHYIVLRGVTSDRKILVADCANRRNNNKKWDLSVILSEAKSDGGGGPFWIISK